MGVGSSTNFDSVYNESKPYVIGEEVPIVIQKAEEKLKALDNSRKNYLSSTKEKEIHKDVHFQEEEFDIILEGNGEKTKELIQHRFPRCTIEVTTRCVGGYSGGTGQNTYEDTYVKDTLRFRCQ